MKYTFSKAALIVIQLSTATCALANEVDLLNSSNKHPKPVVIYYQIAHQNPGKDPVFTNPKEVILKDNAKASLHVNPEGYQYSGIVVLSVDNHILPSQINQFGKPGCTIATDKNHPGGAIDIAYKGPNFDEVKLTCASHGGVTF